MIHYTRIYAYAHGGRRGELERGQRQVHQTKRPRGQGRRLTRQEVLRPFKADIFQALAHPTRIAVVELLCDGEVPAGVIFTQVGVEQANVLYTSSEGGMRD